LSIAKPKVEPRACTPGQRRASILETRPLFAGGYGRKGP